MPSSLLRRGPVGFLHMCQTETRDYDIRAHLAFSPLSLVTDDRNCISHRETGSPWRQLDRDLPTRYGKSNLVVVVRSRMTKPINVLPKKCHAVRSAAVTLLFEWKFGCACVWVFSLSPPLQLIFSSCRRRSAVSKVTRRETKREEQEKKMEITIGRRKKKNNCHSFGNYSQSSGARFTGSCRWR